MTAEEFREDPGEEARFRRLLAARLPRHAAPAHLRAAISALAAPPHRASWVAPALSALATALVLGLVALPLLPRNVEPDPLRSLVSAVLSQHTRSLMWGEERPEAVPAALPRFMEQTGIALSWFFQGDDEIQLINAEPLVVEGRRALALTYKDRQGHTLTYMLLPGAGMALPEQGRVKIDGFRPLLTQTDGWSIFVWKQKDLACFLISDLVSEQDLTRFKQVFLKVRLGTEPPPTS
ncbi:MAG: hypothetical protein HYV92_15180 [Candidatus Rokubacteria bacterium]|nr:hypothetical protein [Candidatus Rokubacteria bacterium]MBI2555728.1 hypothetical protein [Candidatus Rokubacteria bacterium]